MKAPSRSPLPQTGPAGDRWNVASRVLAAVVGGYLLTSSAIVFFSVAWPGPRARAVLGASLLGILILAMTVMYVFAVRTVRRAWLGPLLVSGILGVLAWLIELLKKG